MKLLSPNTNISALCTLLLNDGTMERWFNVTLKRSRINIKNKNKKTLNKYVCCCNKQQSRFSICIYFQLVSEFDFVSCCCLKNKQLPYDNIKKEWSKKKPVVLIFTSYILISIRQWFSNEFHFEIDLILFSLLKNVISLYTVLIIIVNTLKFMVFRIL